MTVVRSDTFQRANQTGWGTASDGNVWTVQSGNGTLAIASNEGGITGSGSSNFNTLGAALSGADAEGVVRFSVGDNTHNTAGILLRWTDASNHWLARFNGAAGAINVMVKVAGAYTSQANFAVTTAINTYYWLRFRCQGTTISLKFWADGSAEPGTWTQQFTGLTQQNVAGAVGLYGYSNSTSGVNFDSFSVDDLAVTTHTLGVSARAQFTSRIATLDALTQATFSVQSTLLTLQTSGRARFQTAAALAAAARATFLVNGPAAGTGIADITRSSGLQYANKSGNGYGTGDISGTEFDYIATAADGSGWAIGANPWYGGMPASAWYQIDPGLNATLPQKTSATGNQMTLLTTQSGGTVHWEEAVGGTYQASELPTFQNAGNLTELAPANTGFRAYVKAIGDAPDANGISWTAWMCIYPGDPGLVVFRFDQHNGTGSAITVDESDIELIASLLPDNGANPAGIWNPANAFYGSIGGSVTSGWPAAGVHQNGTFDFTGITPNAGSGIVLGTGAAVLADPSTQFGWAAGGYEMNETAASATTPGRIKFGFYSGPTSNWTIPAGQTNTYYVLRVFRRNLTSADMAAIAADWKYPGTSPTVTVGSFTQWNTDERAYEFAASANTLTATLDLSQTHVTVRYKPVIKVSGWTGGAPQLTWGGAALTAGVDYRYYNDTTTSTLYLQLYFDIVTSGATTGQRNNAALAVQGTLHSLSTALRATEQIAAVIGVGARAQFATRVAMLASVTRSAFASRVATLGGGGQSHFQTRAALTEQMQTRFVTRTTQSVVARARFDTRVATLATEGQSRYALRFGLLQGARAQFVTRFTTALQGRVRYVSRFTAAVVAQSRFVLRAGLAATTQATFVFRSNLTQLAVSARAQFIARHALLSEARASFQTRRTLVQAARARFALRFPVGTTAQARFATRVAALATPARGAFRVLLALRVVGEARYRVLIAVLQAARARFLVHALGVGWHGPGAGGATTSSDAAGVSATQNDAAEISATQEQ